MKCQLKEILECWILQVFPKKTDFGVKVDKIFCFVAFELDLNLMPCRIFLNTPKRIRSDEQLSRNLAFGRGGIRNIWVIFCATVKFLY